MATKKATTKKTGTSKQTTPTTTPKLTPEQERDQAMKTAGLIANKAEDFSQGFADKYVPQGTFGQISAQSTPEMLAYLNNLRGITQTAGNLTPLEQQSIAAQQAGLGGYNSPELQAQREAAHQNLNQNLATQLRLQQLSQARSGVRGAAASAGAGNLIQGSQQAGANVERDLFAKNADVIQQRKEAFSSLVQNTEAARFGRQTAANQQYGTQLTGEEAANTAKQTFNVGQRQNEGLARSGAALSGAGIYTGLYGNTLGNDTTNKYIDTLTTSNDSRTKDLNNTLQGLLNTRQLAPTINITAPTANPAAATPGST